MTFTRIRQAQVQFLVENLQQIREQIKTFKEPIPLLENMPLEGNNDGDLRVCLENGKVYIWKESETKWILSSGISGTYGKIINISVVSNNQTVIETDIKFNDPNSDFQTNSTSINLYLNGVLVGTECYSTENIADKLVITWLDSNYPLRENDQIGIQYYDILGGQDSGNSGSVNLTKVSTNILPLEPNTASIGSEELPFKEIYVSDAKVFSNFVEISAQNVEENYIGIKLNQDSTNQFLIAFDKIDNELKFGKRDELHSIAHKTWTEQKIDEKILEYSSSQTDLSEEEIQEIINQILS